MDFGLNGKHALVTGGSQGIGFSIAKTLLQEGCIVTIASRNLDKLVLARESLTKDGALVDTATVHLEDEKSVREFWSSMKQKPDIVVINVGGPKTGNPTEISIESWDEGYHLLLRSVMLITKLCIPNMKEKKWGRVLTVTSTAAKELIPLLPISSTFRAGLSAFSKALAKEVGNHGILVNNLLPGPTRTERLKELETKSKAFFDSMESEMALGRLMEPNEVSRVATFLCSNANTVVTGIDMVVDGGFTRFV